MLKGRQMFFLMYEVWEIDSVARGLLELEDLTSLRLANDNLRAFRSDWDDIIQQLRTRPSDEQIEELFRSQLRTSQQFNTTMDLYWLQTTQMGVPKSYYNLRQMLETYLSETRRQRNRDNFSNAKRHTGPYAGPAAGRGRGRGKSKGKKGKSKGKKGKTAKGKWKGKKGKSEGKWKGKKGKGEGKYQGKWKGKPKGNQSGMFNQWAKYGSCSRGNNCPWAAFHVDPYTIPATDSTPQRRPKSREKISRAQITDERPQP